MSDADDKLCPDCEGAMFPIVILDQKHGGIGQLTYRLPDDKRSFWTGQFPTAGPVIAYLCADCGRIALYGQPNPQPAESPR
jgi:hypothetical protein